MIDLRAGDCRKVLRDLDPDSVDAVVCDPPYELGFMGKSWDAAGVSFQPETWAEAYRVLKPGGFLLAFGGTRTHHRIGVAIEDAGFEIRDTIAWIYGQGFPKSLDVSKAIDRAAGVEREVVGVKPGHEEFVHRTDAHAAGGRSDGWDRPWRDDPEAIERSHMATAPATPEAERWQGWGTALKPAFEPIVVGRKPFRGTVVANVLAHGTGALNIDACRVGFANEADERESKDKNRHGDFDSEPRKRREGDGVYGTDERTGAELGNYDAPGRWPANVVLGHHDDCVPVGLAEVASDGHYPAARPGGVEVGAVGHVGQEGLEERHTRGELVEVWDCHPGCPIRILDEQSGISRDGVASGRSRGFAKDRFVYSDLGSDYNGEPQGYGGEGGASRFFYCAKTSRAERNAGLEGFERKLLRWSNGDQNPGSFQSDGTEKAARNHHPTVKPVAVMRWLVRLVTPPGGVVLDPFMGSGTTGIACVLEGFGFVGVESNEDEGYLDIARARIAFWEEHGEGALRIVAEREQAERRRSSIAESGQLDLLSGA